MTTHTQCAIDQMEMLIFSLTTTFITLIYQTSGGLLAAIPTHVAQDLLAALHSAGYDSAAVIGTVIKRRNADELVILTD